MTFLAMGARRRHGPSSPPATTYNVPSHTTIPTYDGSGICVHPDVVDFGQIPSSGGTWRGWRYWMAMTPYYNLNSALENPSIVVSSDGVTWQVPAGLTNPLYPTPATGWNSDPDLSYDPDSDELVLVFRVSDFTPRVARSSDGVTWPASPSAPTWTLVGNQGVSPALVRTGTNQWSIWEVVKATESFGGGPRSVYRWTTNSLGVAWGSPTLCTGFPANTIADPGIWHCDVVKVGTKYMMLAACGREDENPTSFHTASSTDGLAWTWNPDPIIVEGSGGWDNAQLYRGTLQPHENGTHMRVWYGGRSGTGSEGYHVGLTYVPMSEWPTL